MHSIAFRPSRYLVGWAVAAGAAAIIFFHLWQLTTLPRGLYVDESSIGYNAALIAATLHDEHGARLPIYFKAFGEYKHPLFIYATALLYRLFGLDEIWLRFTSFLFFAAFLGILTVFVHTAYKSAPTTLFILLAGGLLPWFFPMSRIGFEVVSQLPVLAGAIACVYLAFHGKKQNRNWYAVIAGTMLGLSVYTYSSSKLWMPLQLLAIWIVYLRPHTIRKNILIAIAALLVSIPAIQFSLNNPRAFQARFQTVTYIYDSSKTFTDKAAIFTQYYGRHFGLPFLVLSGDTNLRHATGYGGELFGIVAVLAGAGIFYVLFVSSKHTTRPFYFFLLLNLIIAPIPAALTLGDTGHSLRTTLMGIVLLIFAAYGLVRILTGMSTVRKYVLATLVVTLLVVESGFYLAHYFSEYAKTTVVWFESYGFEQALDHAIAYQPEHILVSSKANASYIQARFYGQILRTLPPSYISAGTPVVTPNTCLILFPGNIARNPENLPIVESFRAPGSRIHLRCYLDRQ